MGRLVITQVKDIKALAGETASPLQQELPSVLAEVQVGSHQFLFTIAGAPSQYIVTIPTIASTLGELVAGQNAQYREPQQITFLTEKFFTDNLPAETVTAIHSASALCELLERVINDETLLIKALLIDDQAKPFQYGNWVNGGLERLLNIYPQIKPSNFSHLAKFRLLIVPNSVNIIVGVKELIMSDGLMQLTTFDLSYSCRSQASSPEQWLALSRNEIFHLSEIYETGFKRTGDISDDKFKSLRHLRLPAWIELNWKPALKAIGAYYSQLNTLAIDAVIPIAKEETQLSYEVSELNEIVDEESNIQFFNIYIENAEPLENSRKALRGLDKIVEEYKDNQLECLEIYYWYPDSLYPVFACEKLQLYIASEWLPKLNSIIMRPALDQPLLSKQLLDEKTAMDTSGLLFILITRETAIKTLQLLLPEKTGYQAWLTHMAKGGFPHLTHLSYRVPDQLIEENQADYHDRVRRALIDIRRAVRKNPHIEVCMLEGRIPSQFENIVQKIDHKLFKRRSQRQEKELATA
jgi:hypothetical protein